MSRRRALAITAGAVVVGALLGGLALLAAIELADGSLAPF